jgi:cephalosporin hydroxylase
MHPESYVEMSRLVTTYLKSDQRLRVLDVGSYDVNGTYRPLFDNEHWCYEGADMQAGPNVDHVLPDLYRWSFEDEAFDVLISGQTFEHIKFFWLTWKEMVRVLKPGGLIFLIAPSAGAEHRFPVDCWRFYRDGFQALGELENLEVLEAETRWTNTWGDTVGVFRKPLTARRQEPDGTSVAGEPERTRSLTPLPKIREADYAMFDGMSVADWMIYHQDRIVFEKVQWMGVQALKNPLDCWIYQEILWEVRPEVVVEIGSFAGGSTLYFCHLCDLIGQGLVVSLDADRSHFQVQHLRLVEITGDCWEPAVTARVAALCAGKRTMVVHDAEHTQDAVLRALRLYADFVSPGSYFIVEDGIVDVFDPRVSPQLGWDRPGPLAAIREFLREDKRFVIDKSRERYLITYNPCGFLRRVK